MQGTVTTDDRMSGASSAEAPVRIHNRHRRLVVPVQLVARERLLAGITFCFAEVVGMPSLVPRGASRVLQVHLRARSRRRAG
jgi:hypothetical protein